MRVLIVGAGAMGLSVAHALVQRGHEPVLFDQGPIPNPLASSFDQHRLIRYPYGDSAAYTRMVGPAFAAWQALWADLGQTLYYNTGTLCLKGPAPSPWFAQSLQTLTDQQVPLERLDRATLLARYPMLSGNNAAEALYLPSGGVLLAGAIITALADWLRARGVALHAHAQVSDIDVNAARITLANGHRYDGDQLIVASGPWTEKLLPALNGQLTPSRQVVAYLRPPSAWEKAWQSAPMLLDIDPATGFYAVPPVPGTGLKVGDHRFSLSGDPDADRAGAEAEALALVDGMRPYLTDGAAYILEQAKVCFYTVAAEERFQLRPLGGAAWLMACCSGHGFKFSALFGQWLAEALHSGDAGDLTARAAGLTE
jgi:glycine/D-amino acid oxidase-like deaminating enzyme